MIAKIPLWAPRVLSEGPLGPQVAHLAPFRNFGGPLGPPVSALGPPRDPPSPRKKNERDFQGHLGGANLRLP